MANSRGGGYDLAIEKQNSPSTRSFIGNMAARTAPAPVGSDPQAPESIGDLMSPTVGRAPPPSSPDEFNQTVKRNMGFLQAPETQAMLMQFAQSLAGGEDFGGAISSAMGARQDLIAANSKAAHQQWEDDIKLGQYNLDLAKYDFEQSKARLDEVYRQKQARFEQTKFEYGLSDTETDNVLARDNLNLERQKYAFEQWKYLNPQDPPPTEFQKELSAMDVYERAGDTRNADLTWARLNQMMVEFTGSTGERYKPGQRPPSTSGNVGAPAATRGGGKGPLGSDSTGGAAGGGGTPGIVGEGYDPTVEALSGSKAAREADAGREKRINEHVEALDTSVTVTNATNDLVKMIDSSNTPDITVAGLGGFLQYIPATEAANAAGMINTIKANVTFAQLAKIRATNEHGAAVGQVSNMEDTLLGSTLASLDQTQTAAQLRFNLKKIAYLYDPGAAAERRMWAAKLEDGSMTIDQAKAAFDHQYRTHVLGPEANRRAPILLDTPPEDAPKAIKEKWPYVSEANKLKFYSEDDQYIYQIQQQGLEK